jgi:hypothetical protein
MSTIEVSVILLTAIAAVVGVLAVVVTVRLVPVLRAYEALARDARETLGRIDRIAGDLERTSGDMSRIERRVAGSLDRVMDQVEPPIRTVAALIAGVRGAARVLIGGRRPKEGREDPGGGASGDS